MTEIEKYNKIYEILTSSEVFKNEYSELTSFIDKKIEEIRKRNEKAKANRQKKAAASDELSDGIAEFLSDNWLTAEEISYQMNEIGFEATPAKIHYRCKALIDDELIERSKNKDGKVIYKHL